MTDIDARRAAQELRADPTRVTSAPAGATRATAILSLMVRQMRWQSDGVMSLVLEDPSGAVLPSWTPGAHVDLHLPGGLVRQYSLCGSTEDRHRWRIAVLLESSGRGGSRAVHHDLRPGGVVEVRGPTNTFELQPAGAYRFVAGGIGITPILPMIRRAHEQGTPWSLTYGGRSRASMAFVDELPTNGGTVTVLPQDEAGLLPLPELFHDVEPNTLIYACGPAPLLDAMQAATVHWPRGSLVIERFAPLAPVASDEDAAFEVEAASSGVTVRVEPGVSIVRSLESVGVFPETSCEEGICGTCETRVLAGTPEHRDSLLSEDERESGETMMICVSRCVGGRLVLDL